MKRTFVFFLAIILCFLSACSAQPPTQPVLDFQAKVSIDGEKAFDGLFSLQAEVSSTMQGAVVIKVTTPDELWGLTYKWTDNFEIIYEGLHAQTQKGYLPKDSYAEAIYNVLCALSREEQCDSFSDGVAVFTGDCASGTYKVTTDSKGYIRNISVEEINLSADFTYE
ncbi:MAG: hypothetical protein IJ298_10275 [Ruminococcus sp.]|nr:hypothetical protein [Ruminococcus sp.]